MTPQASDRGNCTRFAVTFEDLLLRYTGASTVGMGIDSWSGKIPLEANLHFLPTLSSSNLISMYFGLKDSTGCSVVELYEGRNPVTDPAAEFTRPSDTSMFFVRTTLAPTATVSSAGSPPAF